MLDIYSTASPPPRALDQNQPPRAASSNDVFQASASDAVVQFSPQDVLRQQQPQQLWMPPISPRDIPKPTKPLPATPAASPRALLRSNCDNVATVGVDLRCVFIFHHFVSFAAKYLIMILPAPRFRRDKVQNVLKITGCVAGGEVEAAGLMGVSFAMRRAQHICDS